MNNDRRSSVPSASLPRGAWQRGNEGTRIGNLWTLPCPRSLSSLSAFEPGSSALLLLRRGTVARRQQRQYFQCPDGPRVRVSFGATLPKLRRVRPRLSGRMGRRPRIAPEGYFSAILRHHGPSRPGSGRSGRHGSGRRRHRTQILPGCLSRLPHVSAPARRQSSAGFRSEPCSSARLGGYS